MSLTTKTISLALHNGYSLELRLSEDAAAAESNASTVSWALVLTSGSANFRDYRIGWTVSLAGTAVSAQDWATAAYRGMDKHSQLTVASGTASVAHDPDGRKTMAAAASITMSRSSYAPINGSGGEGTVSLSGSMALTAIPRASALTAADGTLGTAQTLTVIRASEAFTHTLTYTCGRAQGTLLAQSAAASVSWTPPLSLAEQNTGGATVAVTFTLVTWSGSARVGSVTRTVSMTIPASVKPAATASVELVNEDPTVAAWGVAVKGWSRYRITTGFTPAAGSTLRARSVRVAATGETLTASPALSRPLASTDRSVRVQVQDSRGRWSGTVTVNGPAVYDYGDPWISAATAVRCDGEGQEDGEGECLSVRCSGGVYSCGGRNGKTVRVRTRVSGAGWGDWTALTDGEAAVLRLGMSPDASCEAAFSVTDSLGRSKTVTVTVPSAAVALNFRPGGAGAAFGQYAQRDGELALAPHWGLRVRGELVEPGDGALCAASREEADLQVRGQTVTIPRATIRSARDRSAVWNVNNYYLRCARLAAEKWQQPTDEAGQAVARNAAELTALGIRNEAGEHLIPFAGGTQLAAGGNPLGGLLCMASYLNRGVRYGHDNSVFDTEQGTHDEMVCSDFVSAGLLGIPYENSRAGGCGENLPGPYKCRGFGPKASLLAPNGKEVLITRELAYLFAANDALFELEYEHLSNLCPGDVLFFAADSDGAGVQGNYLNIHHVAVAVDIDCANGYVCVLECGTGTSTIYDYCFTADSDAIPDAPGYNALRIFKYDNDQAASGTIIASRKIYVGRPAWPNVEPVLAKSETVTGNTVTTVSTGSAADYRNLFELPRLDWDFQQGDLVVMHLHSDMNKLNPTGAEDPGKDVFLRVVERRDARVEEGEAGYDPDLAPEQQKFKTKTAWRSLTRGRKRHVPNDRVICFFIDEPDVNLVRVQLRSTNPGQEIHSRCTFRVYRL